MSILCRVSASLRTWVVFGLGLLATAPSARADVLELKDGRLIEGLVVEEGDRLLVLSRFGVSEVACADVAARREGVAADVQVREALARLSPEDGANRLRIAAWLRTLGREEEASALAEEVVALDPENADAHGFLGHVRFRGRWMHPDDARRAEGLERHGDRWYTPEEWANVGAAERDAAAHADELGRRVRIAREAQRLLNLMTSPDRAVRQRARSRLERLAQEPDAESVAKLVPLLDEYVRTIDEAQTRVAAAQSGVRGHLMGEFRVTLAKLKRPIQQLTTSLASGPFASAPVTLQLPELEVIRVNTTGIIPIVGP